MAFDNEDENEYDDTYEAKRCCQTRPRYCFMGILAIGQGNLGGGRMEDSHF